MKTHTPLKQWLISTGRKQSWLADQIGKGVHATGRYCSGATLPSMPTRVLIERVTNGDVRADAWTQ
jgi:hypothetical protein